VEKILQKPKPEAGDGGAMDKVRFIEKKWLEKVRK
jgi:hypothetical protein